MERPKWMPRPSALLPNARSHWYRITNNATGAVVHIYDEIGLYGVTAQDFTREISGIQGDLTVHLNSPGGDVFDGIAIYNALRSHQGNVTTVVDSLAASIASVILQAGNTRIMMRNSQVMIHEASGVSIGNASDMLQTADLLEKVTANIADIYSQKAGTVQEWRSAMKAETWYSADEAVKAGLADAVDGVDEQAATASLSSALTAKHDPPPPAPEIDFAAIAHAMKEGFR